MHSRLNTSRIGSRWAMVVAIKVKLLWCLECFQAKRCYEDLSQDHGDQVPVALDAPLQRHVGDAQTIAGTITAVRMSVSGNDKLCLSAAAVVVAFQMAFWQRPFIALHLVARPLEMFRILCTTDWTLRLNL